MKMICDRTLLSNAVAGVSKAVTQRSSIPVLEGILMKAEGFSLTLTGYDLEMGITTSIEANVLEPGEVPYDLTLSEIYNEDMEPIESAPHATMTVYLKTDRKIKEGAFLRVKRG